jgi:hypothetical protein
VTLFTLGFKHRADVSDCTAADCAIGQTVEAAE